MNTTELIYNYAFKNSANLSYDYIYYTVENQTNLVTPAFLTIITISWTLIEIIGILANICVIVVMLCGSRLTSATQYFIINLAASDMLFLIVNPTLVLMNYHDILKNSDLPEIIRIIICKFDYFITHVTVFITCLTLMSMTFGKFIFILFMNAFFVLIFIIIDLRSISGNYASIKILIL